MDKQKRKRMANNRRVGHSYERLLRREFIELLEWLDCQTSRYASKAMDDAKVDFCYTDPFYFQAKKSKRRPNYEEILGTMPQDGRINVILHKINRRGGGEYAIMDKESLYILITILLLREQYM